MIAEKETDGNFQLFLSLSIVIVSISTQPRLCQQDKHQQFSQQWLIYHRKIKF